MGDRPLVLAGPIVRRAEPERVCVWLATGEPCEVRGEIFGLEGASAGARLGAGAAESARLGEALFVHLLSLRPEDGRFPTDEVLLYDVSLSGEAGAAALGDLELLGGPERITYGELPLPSLVIQGPDSGLNVMHGSCRLLHGKGEDAFEVADEIIARHALDPAQRPAALFLTGDQIYADDVAGPMIRHLRALADRLIGPEDANSVPGVDDVNAIPPYGRSQVARDAARFTSGHASNHLMTFGEFAAMYMIAWSDTVWPDAWPDAADAVEGRGPGTVRLRQKYAAEVRDLERARRALPAVRRALANVPTYMIFDDHDVTDDWNLTGKWRATVYESPTGRRIIANALASFWAFQGWGNDPDSHDEEFRIAVERRPAGGDEFDERMWGFDRWSYRAPTHPPVIVMDTRTQRDYDAEEGAAHLVGAEGRKRIFELARDPGDTAGAPPILVSAVPVCGLELQERRQKYLVRKVGPYEIDFEAWHSNLKGFVALMEFLISDLDLRSCIFLSGDVHYGMNLHFTFAVDENELRITQLVSSGTKHSGTVTKSALQLLGRLVRDKHERIGWRGPPKAARLEAAKRRLMVRAVNTDDWSEDSPVFLSPAVAERLDVEDAPHFRESRSYVRPSGDASMLVGENNIGLVRLRGDRVTHAICSRGPNGTTVHEAMLDVVQDDSRRAAEYRE